MEKQHRQNIFYLGGQCDFLAAELIKGWPNTSTDAKEETGLPSVVATSRYNRPTVLLKSIFRCSCLEYQGTELNNLNPFCYTLLGSTVCTEYSADLAQA